MARHTLFGQIICRLSQLALLLASCGVAPETPNDFPLPPTAAPETPTGVGQKGKVEFIWASTGDATPLKVPGSIAVDSQSNTYLGVESQFVHRPAGHHHALLERNA